MDVIRNFATKKLLVKMLRILEPFVVFAVQTPVFGHKTVANILGFLPCYTFITLPHNQITRRITSTAFLFRFIILSLENFANKQFYHSLLQISRTRD